MKALDMGGAFEGFSMQKTNRLQPSWLSHCRVQSYASLSDQWGEVVANRTRHFCGTRACDSSADFTVIGTAPAKRIATTGAHVPKTIIKNNVCPAWCVRGSVCDVASLHDFADKLW